MYQTNAFQISALPFFDENPCSSALAGGDPFHPRSIVSRHLRLCGEKNNRKAAERAKKSTVSV